MWYLSAIFLTISFLFDRSYSQLTCDKFTDFFININKYDPQFDSIAYVSPTVRVDTQLYSNLITFVVTDRDLIVNNISYFTVTSNDTNFSIEADQANNRFYLNFQGKLFYNINNAHRYVVELTAYDKGVPTRSSKALVFVPLLNYNVHAPQYDPPVSLAAAITLKPGSQLGILNAWDIDGDKVTFQLDPLNNQDVLNTLDLQPDGVLKLKSSLTIFDKSFTFTVLLTDDGSSCDASKSTRIIKQSKMTVKIVLIEVNMHSPKFVPNQDQQNYCEHKFQAYENTYFQIKIVAQDDDKRGENGNITLFSPEISDRSPQYSFTLKTIYPQVDRQITGIVENVEKFDYENPKYGSNIMNIMFLAEDNGVTKRRGYCFMQIEILDENDNVPVFAQRTYTIYIHDQYKTRHFNYRFVATDSDSGLNGQVQYFMDKSNQIAVNLFNLGLDGTLTIKNNSYLDMIKETMSFEIYAEDMSQTRNRSDMVTVRVIKTMLKLLPPFFSDFPDPAEIRDISEMTTRGSLLRNFSITIQTNPADQFLRCFLSPKPTPEWFKFEFLNQNQDLGQHETCYLKVEDPLNYRVSSSMIIYMVAEVGNYLMKSTARELKILTLYLKEENINPPKFVTNTIEASVVEGDEEIDKVIAVVKAYDLDKTFPFNKITYAFDGKSNSDGFFAINETSGEIKLVKRIHNKKNIPLEIVARDGAFGYRMNMPNQNSIYVDVKVIDINDNPPQFTMPSYTFNVSEDAQPGYVIGRLEVTDEDAESFFNFSISDSTFGIRGIFDMSRSKYHYNYKGSAEIYLNNYLDFNKKSQYKLQVFVSDSQFLTKTDLTINVIDVNDRPPVFMNTPYEVRIDEINIPNGPLLTLSAKDDDLLPNDFYFECYSTPYLDKEWFDLNPKTGVLTLKKGLDRDLPNGMPVYYLPVSVTDLGKANGLKSFTTVKIVLNDFNDNPPYVVYGNNKPLIINEGDNSGSVELYVVDVDTPNFGPPFTFILDNYTDIFGIQLINCPNCNDRSRYQLFNKKVLNRNEQKEYIIPYSVSDNGGLVRTGNMRLIVGDVDNNPQQDGSKQIKILSYQDKLLSNLFLGTLYVQDKDDWDLVNKRTTNCQQNPNAFEVRQALQIYGPKSFENFPNDSMSMQCVVTDSSTTNAIAKVDFTVENINYEDTVDLAGIRVLGIRVDDLAKKLNILTETSLLESLEIKLIEILELSPQVDARSDYLKVVTLRNYEADSSKLIPNQVPLYDPSTFGSEIYFFARKNGRLLSSRRIYSLLHSKLNRLESSRYAGIVLLNNICANKPADFCPPNSSCKQNFIVSRNSLTTDANATSFVGMDNILSTDCYSNIENTQPICFNGGTLVSSLAGADYYCNCLEGFYGPRCEALGLTFFFRPSSPSHSFALFKHINLSEHLRIEFEFSTERSKGLLLFNGPTNRDSKNFLAVEIFSKTLLIHIGFTKISFSDIDVSDKQWHKVDISISLNSIQVVLDRCQARSFIIDNYEKMIQDTQPTDENRLSLGGIPPSISINHFYYSVLSVFEYEGCLRNLRVNGDLRNLQLSKNQNEFNSAENSKECDCVYDKKCDPAKNTIVRTYEFPWWIILIICAALLLLGKSTPSKFEKPRHFKITRIHLSSNSHTTSCLRIYYNMRFV
jgi:hypothetical protein